MDRMMTQVTFNQRAGKAARFSAALKQNLERDRQFREDLLILLFNKQKTHSILLRNDKITPASGVEEERNPRMATYITLMKFTGQGIRNVKDSVKRAEAFKEEAKRLGVTVKDIYWTLGQYDIVATVEGPDDPSVTALGLSLGALGNVQTQTLRAFGPAEMKQILDKMA